MSNTTSSHSYAAAGSYVVRVTASDSAIWNATSNATVTVLRVLKVYSPGTNSLTLLLIAVALVAIAVVVARWVSGASLRKEFRGENRRFRAHFRRRVRPLPRIRRDR